ncbi:MAG: four helix bundle protein [Bacteroidetes bacterium]|nr:four helix bundle protein [Bacteroidota bacterium]
MSEFAEILKQRTKSFAISIIKLSKSFPKNDEAFIIKKQLLRSSFSVASNYRAVFRSRSDAEFFSKLCIVVEEADEVVFWLELLSEADIVAGIEIDRNLKEANELLSIAARSRKTMKERTNQQFTNSINQ